MTKGFSFLGQFEGLRSSDSAELRVYFKQLLQFELDLLPDTTDSDSAEFDTQYGFDNWIMALAAIYYATLPPKEALASVAQPILSLGAGAHSWIREFLHAYFRYGPALCNDDADFAQRWKALIDFTSHSPKWDYEKVNLKYFLEQLSCELLGFSGHPSRAAELALQGSLLLIEEDILAWCKAWLKHSDCVAAFARFVAATTSSRFIQLGVTELAHALVEFKQNARREEDLKSSLLAALSNVWKTCPDLVRPGGNVSVAFHRLLSLLTARLVPEALDLQAKVAQG